MWPRDLQALLPKVAKELLQKQQTKFRRDWGMMSKAFPDITREVYLYNWLLVNTRSFYYAVKPTEPLPVGDRMTLQPVADLLNHADRGCMVSFSSDGFTVTADRKYQAGEEIYITYGGHSNDFLLTEYGFILLAQNRWDEVCLDEIILPSLSKQQKAELDDRGFLGNYMLDAETPGCHRTQVALRLLCCTPVQWRRFVDAADDREASQQKVNALLVRLLKSFVDRIQVRLEDIRQLNAGSRSQKELLRQRWEQIDKMVRQTILDLDI
jgi:hypothetical protein